jgi:hypothetical protein
MRIKQEVAAFQHSNQAKLAVELQEFRYLAEDSIIREISRIAVLRLVDVFLLTEEPVIPRLDP